MTRHRGNFGGCPYFRIKGEKMADLIRIKGGALGDRTEMPILASGTDGHELGYRTDTEELYIGTTKGNKRLCGANDLTDIINRINNITAEITRINGDLATINARLDALVTPEAPTE